MKKTISKIKAVKTLPRTRAVVVTWNDGTSSRIDLSALIAEMKVLKPLESTQVFRTVTVGEWGWSLSWGGDMEIASSTLERMAREQNSQVASGRSFSTWMEKYRLSASQAASALGLSRRMVLYFKSGEREVPRTVALACKGWEATLAK